MLRSLNEITAQFRKACRGAGCPAGHGDDLAYAAAWLVSRDLDGTSALLNALDGGFDPSFPPLEKTQNTDGPVSLAIAAIRVASHGPGLCDLMLASGAATDCAIGTVDSPLLLFAFDQFDTTGGSIFPAVWDAMLQARADGVGSSLTSVLLFKNDETLAVLDVPKEEGWRMSCCVPFGYPTGKWGVAARRPAHEVSYRNTWGTPVGFEVNEPLWP